jgi:5-methylcytosine-specific restriction endonuclease McrA
MAKRCTRCGEDKDESGFARDKTKADGLRSHCRSCTSMRWKTYKAANAEHVRELGRKHSREWYSRNQDRARARAAARRAANPEAERDAYRRWRAEQYGAAIAGQVNFEDVWARDNGLCYLCGYGVDRGVPWPDGGSPSLDHVVPLSLGGAHTPDNVALAHLGCNKSKSNRTPGEGYRASPGSVPDLL